MSHRAFWGSDLEKVVVQEGFLQRGSMSRCRDSQVAKAEAVHALSAGTDGGLVEVAFEGVGGRGVVADGALVGVEQLAPFRW